MLQYDVKQEKAILNQMVNYPLKPGQVLWLGPLSCAYLAGDYKLAPWLIPNGPKAPGGKRLPDLLVLDKAELNVRRK